MKNREIVYILSFLLILLFAANLDAKNRTPIKQEYTIELIDQKNIKIYSHSTKLTYICTFEEINETLLKDNL